MKTYFRPNLVFLNLFGCSSTSECRKTKTKAITMADHNKRRQHNEPMRTQSKFT